MKSKIIQVNVKQGDEIIIDKNVLVENGYDEEYEVLSKSNNKDQFNALLKRIQLRIGVLYTISNSKFDLNDQELNQYYNNYLYNTEDSYSPEELKEFKVDAKYEICTELVFEYYVDLFKIFVTKEEIKPLQEENYHKLMELTNNEEYAKTIYDDENTKLFERLIKMDKLAEKLCNYFNFK